MAEFGYHIDLKCLVVLLIEVAASVERERIRSP